MQLNPYLSFNGQCEEAFKFYEECLKGKIEMMMTYEGSPMAAQAPPEWGKKVLHITLRIGEQELMGADGPPNYFQKPQGFSVCINLQDKTEAERIFKELAENGTVKMALEKTFWAERFGMLVDRFGVPWMINCAQASQ
jgi:PhnB protein